MATFSTLMEIDPVLIKAYIDGLAGTTLNIVEMATYGQKILIFVDKT